MNPNVIADDINYIARRYSLGDFSNNLSELTVWKEILREQKQVILDLFHYRAWSVELKPMVNAHLSYLIKLFPKGNDTIRELIVFFEKERITLPSYRVIQDMFTDVFSEQRERLNHILRQLPDNIQTKLDVKV